MPAQLEDGPFGLVQGLERLSSEGDRIRRRRAEAAELIGAETALADQHVMAVERLGAHAVEHALQLGAVPAVRLAPELFREIDARRIDLIHALGSPRPTLADRRPSSEGRDARGAGSKQTPPAFARRGQLRTKGKNYGWMMMLFCTSVTPSTPRATLSASAL